MAAGAAPLSCKPRRRGARIAGPAGEAVPGDLAGPAPRSSPQPRCGSAAATCSCGRSTAPATQTDSGPVPRRRRSPRRTRGGINGAGATETATLKRPLLGRGKERKRTVRLGGRAVVIRGALRQRRPDSRSSGGADPAPGPTSCCGPGAGRRAPASCTLGGDPGRRDVRAHHPGARVAPGSWSAGWRYRLGDALNAAAGRARAAGARPARRSTPSTRPPPRRPADWLRRRLSSPRAASSVILAGPPARARDRFTTFADTVTLRRGGRLSGHYRFRDPDVPRPPPSAFRAKIKAGRPLPVRARGTRGRVPRARRLKPPR